MTAVWLREGLSHTRGPTARPVHSPGPGLRLTSGRCPPAQQPFLSSAYHSL